MDKGGLVERFRALQQQTAAGLEANLAGAREGMRVDGTHRPTNRGERAAVTGEGYLALGLGQRLQALRTDLERLDEVPLGPCRSVGPGAVARLVDGERSLVVIVLPGGQGQVIEAGLGPVQVISPLAPLARALAGRGEGDQARVGPRTWAVEEVW